jgi:hypothetical protein
VILWVVSQCSDVEDHAASSFRVKMEAARSSKTLVSYYIIAGCHNPEDHELNLHCHGNLKSRFRIWNRLRSTLLCAVVGTINWKKRWTGLLRAPHLEFPCLFFYPFFYGYRLWGSKTELYVHRHRPQWNFSQGLFCRPSPILLYHF